MLTKLYIKWTNGKLLICIIASYIGHIYIYPPHTHTHSRPHTYTHTLSHTHTLTYTLTSQHLLKLPCHELLLREVTVLLDRQNEGEVCHSERMLLDRSKDISELDLRCERVTVVDDWLTVRSVPAVHCKCMCVCVSVCTFGCVRERESKKT